MYYLTTTFSLSTSKYVSAVLLANNILYASGNDGIFANALFQSKDYGKTWKKFGHGYQAIPINLAFLDSFVFLRSEAVVETSGPDSPVSISPSTFRRAKFADTSLIEFTDLTPSGFSTDQRRITAFTSFGKTLLCASSKYGQQFPYFGDTLASSQDYGQTWTLQMTGLPKLSFLSKLLTVGNSVFAIGGVFSNDSAKPYRGGIIYRAALSPTTDVRKEAAQQQVFSMQLFPNPASEGLTLRFGTPLGAPAEITVISAVGAVMVKQNTGAGVQEISQDIRSLPQGMYFVRVAHGESVAVLPFCVLK